MSILSSIGRHLKRLAVVDAAGSFTYGQLLSAAVNMQPSLRDVVSPDARQPRIAYLMPRDNRYVISKCATWLAGGIGVPLAENHPPEELKYTLEDSGASVLLTAAERRSSVQPIADALGIRVIEVPSLTSGAVTLPAGSIESSVAAAGGNAPSDGAFLIYTSGTTGRPKGVLTTHAGLCAQVHAMASAWGWSEADRVYSVLPLHHVHGVVAIVLTGLASGATVELAPRFDAVATWKALSRPPPSPVGEDTFPVQPTLFMAVPTVYAKLLEAHSKAEPETAAAWVAGIRSQSSVLRLMVSGSAALPETVAKAWTALTGHTLLERYGMTEFAMAISNPLVGERRPNTVGLPLPGFSARIVPEVEGADPKDGGELQISGPGVFREYWNKPEATSETFTENGWFKTGDRVIQDADGYIAIQGASSGCRVR